MVSPGQVAAFTALAVVMVVVPGPSVLFTISRALTLGRRDALLTVVGNAAGVYLQIVAVAFGLGAVVDGSAAVFTLVKLAGAGYLGYLGVRAVWHRRALAEVFGESGDGGAVGKDARARRGRTPRVLRDGFVVGFANPKSIVFLAAVLPQFVERGAAPVPAQILVLGIVLPVVAVLSDSGWALAASAARDWFARSPRRLELLGGVSGLTMIGLGLGLALTGRKDS